MLFLGLSSARGRKVGRATLYTCHNHMTRDVSFDWDMDKQERLRNCVFQWICTDISVLSFDWDILNFTSFDHIRYLCA